MGDVREYNGDMVAEEIMDEEIFELARQAGEAAVGRGVKICAAESCTGGMAAAALTHWPGSSRWFSRGVVCYDNAAKESLLGVPSAILSEHGAVSEQVAAAMCEGVGEYSFAITGIAGPSGGNGKPVGMVCFAWRAKAKTRSATFHFQGNRAAVRRQAAARALSEMTALLKQN